MIRRGQGKGSGKNPKDTAKPPWLAEFLLAVTIPRDRRPDQLGDLCEGFVHRNARGRIRSARRWYWRQVLKSLAPNLALRFRRDRTASEGSYRSLFETAAQDLRHGVRSMAKDWRFAAISITTLALAIGVNTAIFSLINGLLLADLPMRDPDTVAIIRMSNAGLGLSGRGLSYPDLLDYRDQNRSFSSIAVRQPGRWVLSGEGEPQWVNGFRVSDNFFDTWRVEPILGRGFLAGEDRPDAEAVVVLSHGFWTRHFAAQRDVLDREILLDGRHYTVVGVMPRSLEFFTLRDADVWLPLEMDRGNTSRGTYDLYASGRLLPGVSVETAATDLRSIGASLAEQYPSENAGWVPHAAGARESILDDDERLIMALLIAMVASVLAVAFANVTNVLLARAAARRRELSVRTALGAGRGRLVRQLLTECMVIAISAAALGLAISRGMIRLLIAITGGQEVAFLMATLDGHVLAFTTLVCVLTPLAIGLFPALKASSQDVCGSLKEGGARAGTGKHSSRTRGFLVAGQVSLGLMLMVVAGLIAKTVAKLNERELGYDPSGVLAMRLDLPRNRFETDNEVSRFFEETSVRVGALPGVEDVALVSSLPSTESGARRSFEIENRATTDSDARPVASTVTATPQYFALLRLPILGGRGFTEDDTPQSVPVALVSRQTVDRYFPNHDPIGSRIRIGGSESSWVQIVGVVGDVRNDDGDAFLDDPHIYLPFSQNVTASMALLARSERDPRTLSGAARDAVWSVDADQPIQGVETMDHALRQEASMAYAITTLFASFALLALVMATIGVYGVTAYSVSQRTGEICVRLALGAGPGQVIQLVVRQGSSLLLYGGLFGLFGAAVLCFLMRSILFGIRPLDLPTFGGAVLVLGTASLLANYLPARRATRLDPMHVLRTE